MKRASVFLTAAAVTVFPGIAAAAGGSAPWLTGLASVVDELLAVGRVISPLASILLAWALIKSDGGVWDKFIMIGMGLALIGVGATWFPGLFGISSGALL